MTIKNDTVSIGNSEIKVNKNNVIINGNVINLDSETGLPIGITTEDPNFLNILKSLNLSKYEIQTILLDYYSGEPLKNILTRTVYISLIAIVGITLVYPILVSGPQILSFYSQFPKSDILNLYNEIIELNEKENEKEN